jgi:hypothetical protein
MEGLMSVIHRAEGQFASDLADIMRELEVRGTAQCAVGSDVVLVELLSNDSIRITVVRSTYPFPKGKKEVYERALSRSVVPRLEEGPHLSLPGYRTESWSFTNVIGTYDVVWGYARDEKAL